MAFVLLLAPQTFAAVIAVTPSTASITQGSTFSVSVRVNTQGQNINVAEASVVFPSDLLQVVSVSPGSTFTLQTPGSPSKSAGRAFFSAGVPSGYNGASGLLGKITFKAVTPGQATIAVSGGKALLNDGNGTDAFSGGSSSIISITIPPDKPTGETVTPPVTPPETVTEEPIITEPLTPMTPEIQPTNIVTTITITTHDLFVIMWILIALVLVLGILCIYLWRKNVALEQEVKDVTPTKVKLSVKSEKV